MTPSARPVVILVAVGSCPSLAGADVVYTDIPDVVLTIDQQAAFDINADGVDDVLLTSFWDGPETHARGLAGATIFASWLDFPASPAEPFTAGTLIGPDPVPDDMPQYVAGDCYLDASFGKIFYDWPDDGAYLALEFPIDGQAHYAWVHLASTFEPSITVFGFAYDSTPGTPIAAGAVPAPASLAFLALGCAAATKRSRVRARN